MYFFPQGKAFFYTSVHYHISKVSISCLFSARGGAVRGRPPAGTSAGPNSQPRRNSLTRATPAGASSSTGARPESFTDLKRVVSEMVAAAEAAGDAPAPAERSRADVSADADLDARVMPPEALQMGAEAQSRFLKAKVRVLQEELDKAAAEVKRLVLDCSLVFALDLHFQHRRSWCTSFQWQWLSSLDGMLGGAVRGAESSLQGGRGGAHSPAEAAGDSPAASREAEEAHRGGARALRACRCGER